MAKKKKYDYEQRELFKTVDDAILWIKRYNDKFGKLLFGKGNIFELTQDIIREFYLRALQIGIECPFIFNYNNNFGMWAIKRDFENIFRNYYKNINPSYDFHEEGTSEGLFCGFHNGKDTNNKPKPDIYEFLIAAGLTKHFNQDMSIDDVIHYVIYNGKKTKGDVSSEEQIKEFIKNNIDKAVSLAEKIVKQLNITNDNYKAYKVYKGEYLKSFQLSCSEYGIGKKTVEGKTDIILSNGISSYHISIKFGNTSQAFSMSPKEFYAMVQTCNVSLFFKNILSAIYWEMYTYKGDYKKLPKNIKDKNDVLKDKHNGIWYGDLIGYTEDKKEFYRQGLSGEIKFGKGADATADYILHIDTDLLDCQIYTIDDYVEMTYDEVDFKFSSKAGYEAFRARLYHILK